MAEDYNSTLVVDDTSEKLKHTTSEDAIMRDFTPIEIEFLRQVYGILALGRLDLREYERCVHRNELRRVLEAEAYP